MNNPSTGSLVGSVPNMGAVETRRAIDRANATFPTWRAKIAKERSAILRRWSDQIMASQMDLATIITAEQGKPLVESRGETANPIVHKLTFTGSTRVGKMLMEQTALTRLVQHNAKGTNRNTGTKGKRERKH